MFYMSEKEFREKKRKARLRNEVIVRKQELKKIKNMYKPQKKIQTSKVITAFLMVLLLINCIAIEIYSCYAMLVLQDLSALYVLIGASVTTVIGEVLAYTVYSLKSFHETKAEKNLEFEKEKFYTANNNTKICDDEAVG